MMIGLHIMRPTTVDVAGAGTETATIRADGGVDFANATSLSLNGVFTAAYDNYMISIRHVGSTTQANVNARLRLSGTDASGTDYTNQSLQAYSTSIAGARQTSQTAGIAAIAISTQRDGSTVYLYGPALAQPTAARAVDVNARDGAWIKDHAWTHSLSTAYDGITLYPASGTFSGMVTVYGYAQ